MTVELQSCQFLGILRPSLGAIFPIQFPYINTENWNTLIVGKFDGDSYFFEKEILPPKNDSNTLALAIKHIGDVKLVTRAYFRTRNAEMTYTKKHLTIKCQVLIFGPFLTLRPKQHQV